MLSRKDLEVLSRLRVGGVVSGSLLSTHLGVSRAYIHKVVDRLRRWGIPIEGSAGVGYRLPMEDDLRLIQYLTDIVGVGTQVEYVGQCVESSQDVARKLAAAGARSWTVVVCDSMESGRGRLGRVWYAPSGGLWFTVLIRPVGRGPLHLLSLASGVSVAESVEAILGVGARVKWPNDVLVDEKKVCGILVEADAEADSIRSVFLGIGINANNDLPKELRTQATSLKEVTGRPVPRATLLALILARLRRYYGSIESGEADEVISAWIRLSSTIGRVVRVVTVDGREIVGRAVTVDRLGRLVVEVSGTRYHIEAGDVYHVR